MWLKSWALLLLADGKEEDTATLVLPIAQCHFSKNQAVKKWLPFELMCAVYLEYLDTSNFV